MELFVTVSKVQREPVVYEACSKCWRKMTTKALICNHCGCKSSPPLRRYCVRLLISEVLNEGSPKSATIFGPVSGTALGPKTSDFLGRTFKATFRSRFRSLDEMPEPIIPSSFIPFEEPASKCPEILSTSISDDDLNSNWQLTPSRYAASRNGISETPQNSSGCTPGLFLFSPDPTTNTELDAIIGSEFCQDIFSPGFESGSLLEKRFTSDIDAICKSLQFL